MLETISGLLQPSIVLLTLISVSAVVLLLRPSGSARALLAIGVAILTLCAWTPLTIWLMRPLEERFPPVARFSSVTGIIVIGGAFDVEESFSRKAVALNLRGGRMTGFAAIANRYPNATLVFSGGKARSDASESEAVIARKLLGNLGIDLKRVQFDDRSRNTHENAVFSRRLVALRRGERWLLVTSAADMPRAIGCFRMAGWPVIAAPVDYHTGTDEWPMPGPSRGLELLDWATHEWIGLAYYRLRGWTPSIFPGPEPIAA